ncbi:hypothetical protein H7H98_09340, partial [Mycolicibacterium sphagni]|nr:hypothetical protein [Mycolicibacterium sphagni]
ILSGNWHNGLTTAVVIGVIGVATIVFAVPLGRLLAAPGALPERPDPVAPATVSN